MDAAHFAQRIITQDDSAEEIPGGNCTPIAAVRTVAGVVPQGEIGILRHDEIRLHGVDSHLRVNDSFAVRRGDFEGDIIDVKHSLADTNSVSRKADQTLNIAEIAAVGIRIPLLNPGNATGAEDDEFTPPRLAEKVADPLGNHVVPGLQSRIHGPGGNAVGAQAFGGMGEDNPEERRNQQNQANPFVEAERFLPRSRCRDGRGIGGREGWGDGHDFEDNAGDPIGKPFALGAVD